MRGRPAGSAGPDADVLAASTVAAGVVVFVLFVAGGVLTLARPPAAAALFLLAAALSVLAGYDDGWDGLAVYGVLALLLAEMSVGCALRRLPPWLVDGTDSSAAQASPSRAPSPPRLRARVDRIRAPMGRRKLDRGGGRGAHVQRVVLGSALQDLDGFRVRPGPADPATTPAAPGSPPAQSPVAPRPASQAPR